MDDFQNNVLTNEQDFWKLDDKLNGILIEINRNNNIQSLYSKFYNGSFESIPDISYLTFCYTRKVELLIFRRLIPGLLVRQNRNGYSALNYIFNEPRVNPEYDSQSTCMINLGCLNNPNYYKINHICIQFFSGRLKYHTEFWDDIKEELLKLN